jgi:pyruvate-formate lyase-activating enzyme
VKDLQSKERARHDMRTSPVIILGTEVKCRGYWCSNSRKIDGKALSNPQFIFYIMATNKCNGLCPFCDVQRRFLNQPEPEADLVKLRMILEDLYGRNLISKISITGGEPLLYPERTNRLLETIFAVNPKARVDLTTNGSLLGNLESLKNQDQLATIHLSRHHFETMKNNQLFGLRTAGIDDLHKLAERFPGKISLNCCLVKGFIDSPSKVEQYLDWAATIKNLKSAGFISLMDKNAFCRTNTIAEKEILDWIDNEQFNFGHEYLCDTDICECRVFRRVSKNYRPITAFWWKVKRLDIPYCRQLVFTADNRLTVNFNEIAEIKI